MPGSPTRTVLVGSIAAAAALVGGCGGDGAPTPAGGSRPAAGDPTASSLARFPTILRASPQRSAPGRYDFEVTISSPYDSPERYASGWRVLTPGGRVLGEHRLGHDHASEQPFTRRQTGVAIPSGVTEVLVQPRDLRNGYGGRRVRVSLPG